MVEICRRAFPLPPSPRLAEMSNHTVAVSKMMDVDSAKAHWQIVEHNGTKWIEARSHDSRGEVTKAHRALVGMATAVSEYPILDEHEYLSDEYRLSIEAIATIAKRTGTIIDSYHDLFVELFDTQIEIIEDEPMKYIVMMSDDEFVDFVKSLDSEVPVINKQENMEVD